MGELIPFFAKRTAEEIVDRRFPLARVSTDGRAATFHRHLGFFTNQSTISFNSRFFGFIPLGHAPRRFEAFPNLVGKPVPGAHSSRRRRADVSPEVSTLSVTPHYVFAALSRAFLRAATARSGRNAERLRVENERDVLFGFRASAKKKAARNASGWARLGSASSAGTASARGGRPCHVP